MNKSGLKTLLMYVSFITTISVLNGCDITNPTDGLAIIVATIQRETTVSVNISDHNGINIKSPLEVKFAGMDSAKIIDEVNNKILSRSTTNGTLTFSVDDKTNITEANPVNLILKLHSVNKDYLDVEYPVTLTQIGIQRLYFKMAALNALVAEGIDQVINAPTTGTADPNSGIVTAPVNLTSTSGTTVSIPTGAVLKDNTGTALSGKISVSVTTFTPQASSLFSKQEIVYNKITFIPFTQFSVKITDQNGRTATTFGNASSKVSIPVAGVKNPATSNYFRSGDTVNFFYLNSTGGTSPLGASIVREKMLRLNKINLPGVYTIQSTLSADVDLNSNDGAGSIIYAGTSIGESSPGQRYMFNFGSNWNNNDTDIELVVNYSYGAQEVFSIKHDTLSLPSNKIISSAFVRIAGTPIKVAENNSIAIGNNLLPVSFAAVTYFDVFVQGKCPNENPTNPRRINPSIYVAITRSDGVSFGGVELKEGRCGTYLSDGSYILSATYQGKDYSASAVLANHTVTIEENDKIAPMENTPAPTADKVCIWYYIITNEACK